MSCRKARTLRDEISLWLTYSTYNPADGGEQSVDHILYECRLLEHERGRLKAAVIRSENWPVSKDKRSVKFYKNFKEFANSILLDKVQCVNMTK